MSSKKSCTFSADSVEQKELLNKIAVKRGFSSIGAMSKHTLFAFLNKYDKEFVSFMNKES